MRHLRILVVWLLLLALPLQGYASVTILLCTTGMPAAAAQADEAVAGSHCAAPADVSKCSSCAACCVVAGNTHPITTLVTAKPAGSECIPYIAVFDTAHISTGLERPPHCGDA